MDSESQNQNVANEPECCSASPTLNSNESKSQLLASSSDKGFVDGSHSETNMDVKTLVETMVNSVSISIEVEQNQSDGSANPENAETNPLPNTFDKYLDDILGSNTRPKVQVVVVHDAECYDSGTAQVVPNIPSGVISIAAEVNANPTKDNVQTDYGQNNCWNANTSVEKVQINHEPEEDKGSNANSTKTEVENEHESDQGKDKGWNLAISKEEIFASIKAAQTATSTATGHLKHLNLPTIVKERYIPEAYRVANIKVPESESESEVDVEEEFQLLQEQLKSYRAKNYPPKLKVCSNQQYFDLIEQPTQNPHPDELIPVSLLQQEDFIHVDGESFKNEAGSNDGFKEANEAETGSEFTKEMDENQQDEHEDISVAQDIKVSQNQNEGKMDIFSSIDEVLSENQDDIKLDNEAQYGIQNAEQSTPNVPELSVFLQTGPFSLVPNSLEPSKIVEHEKFQDTLDYFDPKDVVEIQSSTLIPDKETSAPEDRFAVHTNESKSLKTEDVPEAIKQSEEDFACTIEEVSEYYELEDTQEQRVDEVYNYQVEESEQFVSENDEEETSSSSIEVVEVNEDGTYSCNEQCIVGSKIVDPEVLDAAFPELEQIFTANSFGLKSTISAQNNEVQVELIKTSEASKNQDADMLSCEDTGAEINKKFWDSDSTQGFSEEELKDFCSSLDEKASNHTSSQNDGFIDHGQTAIGSILDESDNDDFSSEETKHQKAAYINGISMDENDKEETEHEICCKIKCDLDEQLGIPAPEFQNRNNSKLLNDLNVTASVGFNSPKKVPKKDTNKRRKWCVIL